MISRERASLSTKKRFLLAARSLLLVIATSSVIGLSQAHATTVSIGSFTIPYAAFVDVASVAQGNFGTHVNSIVGYTPDVLVFSNGDVVELRFTDNTPFNGIGYDFLIFESATAEPTLISLALNGPMVETTLIESIGGFGTLNIWGIDLADFGIADNAPWPNPVFLSSPGFSPEIGAVAAVNSLFSQTSAIPEPSAFALMGLGLAGIRFARKKKPVSKPGFLGGSHVGINPKDQRNRFQSKGKEQGLTPKP